MKYTTPHKFFVHFRFLFRRKANIKHIRVGEGGGAIGATASGCRMNILNERNDILRLNNFSYYAKWREIE
jgi:hypothetical protein